MRVHPQELSKLQRPKLLMSTAKYVVQKRKIKGMTTQKIGPQQLQKLLELEAEHENNRTEKRGTYQASKHIDVLADLIEYVYLATSKSM